MKSLILGSSAAASLTASVLAGSAVPQQPLLKQKKVPIVAHPAAKPAPANPASTDGAFDKTALPFLTQYCVSCHSGNSPASGLALDTFKDEVSMRKNLKQWEKVLVRVKNRSMPPQGVSRPKREERQAFTLWVDKHLTLATQASCGDGDASPSPGRVTMRRLNRLEYKNTIRDLIGVNFTGVENFPSDDVGYGFDNIGDVLSLPPMLMEKYVAAAEEIVKKGYPHVVKVLPKDPAARDAYARTTLKEFARHAFRRPVKPEETDRLMEIVKLAADHKLGYEEGIRLALESVLISPHFLYRIEKNPTAGAKTYRLGNFELASRLSYFLWGSMPDDTLFAAAGVGKLRDSAVLEAQVRRMLKDPKAEGLVENFGAQWLQTRRLKNFKPDPGTFPNFDEKLRAAMFTETNMFFEDIVHEDRSIMTFLNGDFTYVNERLAKHYGIPGVKGPQFRRVSLTGTHRTGILTQGSILTLTSNPTRTSPVKRGKWILEQLLNDAPPPPPPGVPELNETKAVSASAPIRVRMQQHRADPKCAGCHAVMDPIGFSLENFDGTGAWRTKDGKFVIDASDKLPDGESFKGASEMVKILSGRKDQFARNLSEKMLTFALGRGMERYDNCAVDLVASNLKKNNYKFSSLVLAVVRSDPFQLRAADVQPTQKGEKNG